jgi:hypothetical protein
VLFRSVIMQYQIFPQVATYVSIIAKYNKLANFFLIWIFFIIAFIYTELQQPTCGNIR